MQVNKVIIQHGKYSQEKVLYFLIYKIYLQPLKFWRFRVLLVPDCYRSSTKTIMDSPTGTHSDIYSALTLEEQQVNLPNV